MEMNIENKEIRGITMRLIWAGFTGVAAIVATVLITYFNLKGQFGDVNKTDTIQDMIINNIQTQQEIQALQIKEVNIRLNDLEYRTKFLERLPPK